MIQAEQYPQALRALQRLIVHAKAQAYSAGQDRLATLLNDIELLPEFLSDEPDRTGEFVEMLQSIVRVHPSCQYIVEEFQRVSAGSASMPGESAWPGIARAGRRAPAHGATCDSP